MGLAPAPVASALLRFADEVGATGPVAVEGGRTHWDVGGVPSRGTRLVKAPAGVLAVEPAEMTVRALAGTTVVDVRAALAEVGQEISLDVTEPGATLGGALALGWSSPRRLALGPVRDAVLQLRYVSADGVVITAGGPTVKNVAGFDLCRLLVGSLGTLGLFGEVILRTRPLPAASRWLSGEGDPFALRAALFTPSALLWDGQTTWCLLQGDPADVDAQSRVARTHGVDTEVAGPPPLPAHRLSRRASQLRDLDEPVGTFVAEVGVGTVHVAQAPPPVALDPVVADLHDALRTRLDPSGRLNPGRDPARR